MDGEMNIETIGQGRPLIYLHDWGFTSQVWSRQVEFFRGLFSNVLIDYNLPRLEPGVDHENILATLAGQIVEQLDGEAPRAILANGLGSFVAYELLDRGLAAEALVLFGGLVRLTNDEKYLSGLRQERVAAMRKSLHANPRKMLSGYYQFAFSGEEEYPPEDLTRSMPLNTLDFLKVAFDAMISHDYQELVGGITCPALIMHGDADKVAPLWQGEAIRKLMPNAELEVCKSAGHVPFLTHYPTINRRVARFLDATAPAAGPA